MAFDTFDEGILPGCLRSKNEIKILICYLFNSVKENMDKEKKATLEMCYNETKKMLEENRHLFDKVLNVLLEKGSLSGEEFVELIKN